MKIHEYQAKEPVPPASPSQRRVCDTADEARAAYETLGNPVAVVKAQIHAGGRGKGGGVKLVRSADEAHAAAGEILGMMLKTPQTGPEGQLVQKVWIEEGSDIAKEYYVGIVLDREKGLPVVMASSEGGMDIEEVAEKTPELILKAPYVPSEGLAESDARTLAEGIGIPADLVDQAVHFLVGISKVYTQHDRSLAEINPLVTTNDGKVLALDAKINFDPNAMFRHDDLVALRDLAEEDAKEIEASKYDLLVHRPRRQHRLHGQRRRARDGDHGRDQALRR